MSQKSLDAIRRILDVFDASQGEIRPHFHLVGESGSGKTHNIRALADELDIEMISVNAAQLTKEGTSGNSLSKALTPLKMKAGQPTIVFVDEFDKLFISGNTNDALAHETTNGVQNEFLTVLENDTAQVFGDFGKYDTINVSKTLFIFAGAYNGEQGIDLDRLRELGLKTEFLGRVSLHFNLEKVTLEQLEEILHNSKLLDSYVEVFDDADRDEAIEEIMVAVKRDFAKNVLGVRMLNTLIHQYFIHGTLEAEEVTKPTFTSKLQMHANRG